MQYQFVHHTLKLGYITFHSFEKSVLISQTKLWEAAHKWTKWGGGRTGVRNS